MARGLSYPVAPPELQSHSDVRHPLFATAPGEPASVVNRLGCVSQRASLRPAVRIGQHPALPWLGAPIGSSSHARVEQILAGTRFQQAGFFDR